VLPEARLNSDSGYRPDIDGLRAVAVLAVVIFHNFPGNLRGGFVGVDIFFVISGYLISGIILRDLHTEKFSYARFYARRIRRIFPALAVVLLVTMPLAWLVFAPFEYNRLLRELYGGVFFVSNFVL